MRPDTTGKREQRSKGRERGGAKSAPPAPARATVVTFQPGTAVVLTSPPGGKKAPRAFSARTFPAGSILGLSGAAPAPKRGQKPVPVSKVQAGLQKASEQIRAMVADIAAVFTEQYRITQIELTLSFNAEGKFLGFGVGGAASVAVTIAPADLAKPK